LEARALRDARGTAGLVAFVVLPVAGLFWVDSLRSSIRAIWRLPEYPGNFFLRQVIDLAVLAGLGLVLAASLAAAVGAENLLSWLLLVATGADGPSGQWLLGSAGFALGIGVNTLLYVAVLTGLPRLRMRLGRVLGPALLVAAGLEVLKTVGRLYVQRTESNPAYQVVAGAVGLLVFLNLLNQLILFAAALSATSTHGPVTDLAAGPTPAAPHATSTAGANTHPHRIIRRSPIRKANVARRVHPHPRRRWRQVRVTSLTHMPSAIRTLTSLVAQPGPLKGSRTISTAGTGGKRRSASKPSAVSSVGAHERDPPTP
jgi:membrane protein